MNDPKNPANRTIKKEEKKVFNENLYYVLDNATNEFWKDYAINDEELHKSITKVIEELKENSLIKEEEEVKLDQTISTNPERSWDPPPIVKEKGFVESVIEEAKEATPETLFEQLKEVDINPDNPRRQLPDEPEQIPDQIISHPDFNYKFFLHHDPSTDIVKIIVKNLKNKIIPFTDTHYKLTKYIDNGDKKTRWTIKITPEDLLKTLSKDGTNMNFITVPDFPYLFTTDPLKIYWQVKGNLIEIDYVPYNIILRDRSNKSHRFTKQ